MNSKGGLKGHFNKSDQQSSLQLNGNRGFEWRAFSIGKAKGSLRGLWHSQSNSVVRVGNNKRLSEGLHSFCDSGGPCILN